MVRTILSDGGMSKVTPKIPGEDRYESPQNHLVVVIKQADVSATSLSAINLQLFVDMLGRFIRRVKRVRPDISICCAGEKPTASACFPEYGEPKAVDLVRGTDVLEHVEPLMGLSLQAWR